MTQFEIARKFGVPQCDVSVAVNAAGIKPIGKDGRTLQWDQEEAAHALYSMYRKREEHLLTKAAAWGDKARSIRDKFREARNDNEQ